MKIQFRLARWLGCAVCAILAAPQCIAQPHFFRVGDIVIANYDKGSIVKIDAATGVPERLGGGFTVPTDVVLDPNGSLYVSEWQGAIKRFDLGDGSVATVLPSGSGPSQIWGIAQGPSGELFVTSRGDHAVYRVNPTTGTAAMMTQGNLLYTPVGIDFLNQGHLVVACLLTNRLVSISLVDNSQSVLTEGGGLDQPWGVAVQGDEIYVGGYDSKELQHVSSGGMTRVVASMPDFPYGLAVDPSGNPVVGLKGVEGSVVRVSPQGTVLRTYTSTLIGQVTGIDVALSDLPALADTDSDGMSNWQEEIAGTNPLEAASILAVRASVQPDATLRLEWSSAAGRTYMVLEADDPSGPFTPRGNSLASTSPLNVWTTTTVIGEVPRFYRIEVQRLP